MSADPRIEAAARAMIGADPDEKIGSAWTITAQLALSAADAADDHVRIKLDEDMVEAIARAMCDDEQSEYPVEQRETMEQTGATAEYMSAARAAVAALRARAARTE